MNMEPMMKEKVRSADLVPYMRSTNGLVFYLQKRDANAHRAPNKIALFGGRAEGDETIEENLAREIKEELDYTLENPTYFSQYETARTVAHIFIQEVGPDFESKITVHEGEYGLFLSNEEVQKHPDVTPFTKMVVLNVTELLTK